VRAYRTFPNRPDRRFPNRRACPRAGRANSSDGLRVGKPAIRQTWKSAVRKNRLVPADGFENHEMPIRCRGQCRSAGAWIGFGRVMLQICQPCGLKAYCPGALFWDQSSLVGCIRRQTSPDKSAGAAGARVCDPQRTPCKSRPENRFDFPLPSACCGSQSRAPVPERGAVTRSTLKSEGLPGFFLLPKAPIALSSSLTTGRWGDLHLTGILCGRTARFPTGRIADFPIGGPVRRPGAPTRRTACGLGNPRYGRLGSLRYEKTASSPPTDLKTMKCP
jgi:hypothetical protein